MVFEQVSGPHHVLSGLDHRTFFFNDVKKEKCNLENPCLMEFGARSTLSYIQMQLFYEDKVCGLRTNLDSVSFLIHLREKERSVRKIERERQRNKR